MKAFKCWLGWHIVLPPPGGGWVKEFVCTRCGRDLTAEALERRDKDLELWNTKTTSSGSFPREKKRGVKLPHRRNV